MTKQYDTQEQIDAFNIYVKQNPAGRQVHHTGTLGYDDDEWKAFQEGWNAALAQPKKEPSYWEDAYWSMVAAMTRDKLKTQLEQEPCVTKDSKGQMTLHSGWDDLPNGAKLYAAPPRAVKTYHEGKPVYVALHPRTFDDYGNKIV